MLYMRKTLKNATYLGRCLIGANDKVSPIFNATKFRRRMVNSDTDICIEGFPRSANSFFYHYFLSLNPGTSVAHHMHVPSQILAASKWNVPTVALVRPPLDALKSVMVIDGSLSVGLALWNYEKFYKATFKRQESLIVVNFKTAVTVPERAIEAVNNKFGTKFHFSPVNSELSATIKDTLINHARVNNQGLQVAVPTQEKDELKTLYENRIMGHPRFKAVDDLYHKVIDLAV